MDPRKVALVLCALLVGIMLAACGGDDPDPTATAAAPGATATPAEAEATPTSAPAEPTATSVPPTPTEEPATPTSEPTATSTVAPTATVAPTETPDTAAADPTATEAVSTPDPDDAADPEAEAALFAMALTEDDFPEGWTQILAEPVTDSNDDLTFCNAEPFSSEDGRLAAVELEFELDPFEGPFVLQNLTAYPEAVSIEAMEYARNEILTCEEWTDESGETFRLVDLDLPDYGDESFGASIVFDVPEFGDISVHFVFVRVGGILLSLGYIDLFATDTGDFEAIIERAVERVQASDYRP